MNYWSFFVVIICVLYWKKKQLWTFFNPHQIITRNTHLVAWKKDIWSEWNHKILALRHAFYVIFLWDHCKKSLLRPTIQKSITFDTYSCAVLVRGDIISKLSSGKKTDMYYCVKKYLCGLENFLFSVFV